MQIRLISILILASASGPLLAQSDAAGSTAGKPAEANPNKADPRIFAGARAADDYEGKRLSFPVNMIATYQYDTTKSICLPAYTRLRGMSHLTKDGMLVRIRDKPERLAVGATYTCQGKAYAQADLEAAFTEPLILGKDEVDAIPSNISGLSYGVLAVPFKYHLNGSKEFKSSGTVGPYAGYKTESGNWASSIEYVGFLGLTSISVERTVDGKPTSDSLAGISYGLAAIGRVSDAFQVGLVLGADRVSKSAKYADNGKLWIAVSIGYAFSN